MQSKRTIINTDHRLSSHPHTSSSQEKENVLEEQCRKQLNYFKKSKQIVNDDDYQEDFSRSKQEELREITTTLPLAKMAAQATAADLDKRLRLFR